MYVCYEVHRTEGGSQSVRDTGSNLRMLNSLFVVHQEHHGLAITPSQQFIRASPCSRPLLALSPPFAANNQPHGIRPY